MKIFIFVCVREINIIVKYIKNILNVCLFIKFLWIDFLIIEFVR